VNKGAHGKTSLDQRLSNMAARGTLRSACRAGYQYWLGHFVFLLSFVDMKLLLEAPTNVVWVRWSAFL
jgi:hypothetical protein